MQLNINSAVVSERAGEALLKEVEVRGLNSLEILINEILEKAGVRLHHVFRSMKKTQGIQEGVDYAG